FFRCCTGIALALLSVLITLGTVLQVPSVQNKLFTHALAYVSARIPYTIQHTHFHLHWLQSAVITGLQVKDAHSQQILAIEQVSLEVSWLRSIVHRRCILKTVHIQEASLYLPYPTPTQPMQLTAWAHQHLPKRVHSQVTTQKYRTPPHLMHLAQIHLKLHNLCIHRHALDVDVIDGTGRCPDSPWVCNQLCTHLHLASGQLHLRKLLLQTAKSCVQGDIQLYYPNLQALYSCTDAVKICATFEESVLSTEELATFFPHVYHDKQHAACYNLRGKLTGCISDFCLENFQLWLGQQGLSQLQGTLQVQGLPHWETAFYRIQLHDTHCQATDILAYIPQQYINLAQQVGSCTIVGEGTGSLRDFSLRGKLVTPLGSIATDMQVAIRTGWQEAAYVGTLTTNALDIGQLLDVQALQHLSMQGQIQGQGLTPAVADVHLKADIHQLGWHDYTYQNIHADGKLKQGLLEGTVAIRDPHLKLATHTQVDWRGPCKQIHARGQLHKADLQALQLTKEAATLRTHVDVRLRGTDLDDWSLDGAFTQCSLDLAGRKLPLHSLHIHNHRQPSGDTLAVDTDLFTAQAKGKLPYTAFVQDIRQFLQSYVTRLTHGQTVTPQYTAQSYAFDYTAYLKAPLSLPPVFASEVYLAPHTHVSGHFSSEKEALAWSIYVTQAEALTFCKSHWINTNWCIQAAQKKDGSGLRATSKLTAERITGDGQPDTQVLSVGINWADDLLDFNAHLAHPDPALHTHHRFNLVGHSVWENDTLRTNIEQAYVQVADAFWELAPQNSITYSGSDIQFENITFTHAAQQIRCVSTPHRRPGELMCMELQGVHLSHLNKILHTELEGLVDGAIHVGLSARVWIEGSLHIVGMTAHDVSIGDLMVHTRWDDPEEKLHMQLQVNHLGITQMDMTGFYAPGYAENSLSLLAVMSDAQLAIIEPCIGGIFSQVAGSVSGELRIQGSLAHLQVTGDAQIRQGRCRVNYFNTIYHWSGAIHCTENEIQIHRFELTDEHQGAGMLQGTIYHTYLRDFELALALEAKQLQVLRTAHSDSDYLYGIGIASGVAHFTGPVHRIVVDIQATTEPGTRITIPVAWSNKAHPTVSYIRFVSPTSPPSSTTDQATSAHLQGILLNMALTLTPAAVTEIIWNTDTQEAIESRGAGSLRIKLDTQGALSVTGQYKLTEGHCQLCMYQVIRRKFTLQPGGSITWYEKPTEGILNCQATDEQRIVLTPLLKAYGIAVPKVDARRYPVQLQLNLSGTLVAPELQYAIHFPELPDDPAWQAAISSFQDKMATSETYRKSQVFSLMVLRMFAPDEQLGSMSSMGRDTIGRNLGEFFSQQVSNLAMQWNKNMILDTAIDLSDLTTAQLKDLHLRVGYNFFGGRLRIVREGALGTIMEDTSRTAHRIGNWTLTTTLTEDGRLSAKFYNRYRQMSVSAADRSDMLMGGFSLLYVHRFNQWRHLFSGRGQ
ncbi:MAG: translocation/assembly module TamB domain-containing protein, partial [Bacteroidota bacterium]